MVANKEGKRKHHLDVFHIANSSLLQPPSIYLPFKEEILLSLPNPSKECLCHLKFFPWLGLKNKLNAGDKLGKKLSKNMGGCIFWDAAEELFDHLFLSYPNSLIIWEAISQKVDHLKLDHLRKSCFYKIHSHKYGQYLEKTFHII